MEERPRPDASPTAGAREGADEESADEEDADEEGADEEGADENIPLQGTHRGSVDDPLTSSVRAQKPAEPTAPAEPVEGDSEGDSAKKEAATGDSAEKPAEADPSDAEDLRTYQLSEDPASGHYRVRVLSEKAAPEAPGSTFEEIDRRASADAFPEDLRADLPDGPRFAVLENTETGEVYFDRANNLSDWQAGGDFDQVTLFEREDEAARYADERQNS